MADPEIPDLKMFIRARNAVWLTTRAIGIRGFRGLLVGGRDGVSGGNPDGSTLGVPVGAALGAREGRMVLGGMLGASERVPCGRRGECLKPPCRTVLRGLWE